MLGRTRCYMVVGRGPYGQPDITVRVFMSSYIDAVQSAKRYIARKELCEEEDVTVVEVRLISPSETQGN